MPGCMEGGKDGKKEREKRGLIMAFALRLLETIKTPPPRGKRGKGRKGGEIRA